MATDKPVIREIRGIMEDHMTRNESRRYFLPDSSRAVILNPATLEKAVKELNCQPDERINLFECIRGEATRIFSILISMEKEDHIVVFRSHQILDKRLPLDIDTAKRVAPEFGSKFAREEQWKFIPFSFPTAMYESHLEIGDDWILPYLERSQDSEEGAFGEIRKMKILPSQQAFVPKESADAHIILKTLKNPGSGQAYRQEHMCLRLLNQLNHPNIIQFLGSYTYTRQQNFIFPCLDMDLKQFLQTEARFGDFRHDFTFYSALRGLCSALLSTHHLHLNEQDHGVDFDAIGYHHDLRPSNILVNQRTFILADFGLGKLKEAKETSKTLWTQTAGDYLAPECMNEKFESQYVGRAIDVWALGCLMADIVVYIHDGSRGVKHFSDSRVAPGAQGWDNSYFYGSDGRVKPQVDGFLRRLPTTGRDAIPTDPLVDLSLQMLVPDPSQRPSIGDVSARLTFLDIRVHVLFVRNNFTTYLSKRQGTEFKLVEIRFLAWGHVLDMDHRQPKTGGELSELLSLVHDDVIKALLSLSHELQKVLDPNMERLAEDSIDGSVNFLWTLLPPELSRRANDFWQHIILSADDMAVMDNIEEALSATRFSAFYATRALAAMKKIRLAMLEPQSSSLADSDTGALLMDAGDVLATSTASYTIGKLKKDNTPILVEWMWYSLGWDQVSPEQRSLVMRLRAQSFGLEKRPATLKTLDCIGLFEEKAPRLGYGFVYRIPPGVQSTPTRLVDLFDQKSGDQKPQPLLGDKFKLALAIADFLKQFHSIGWLHENFIPHNILFFTRDTYELPSSGEIRHPYFVGLHKSRPDGSWQTDGPASDVISDYYHPDYASSGRYQIDFDYYSLGIILLEIGLWRSLSSMLSKSSKMSASEVRDDIKRRCKRLGPKMGERYKDATLKCLDGSLTQHQESDQAGYFGLDIGEGSSKERTVTLGHFIEDIIEPLESLAAACI